jgi:hypothetical protein
MTKSLALDPRDPSSRGDLSPSRDGIPPRVTSIIWNRNFPSLHVLSDPSTSTLAGGVGGREQLKNPPERPYMLIKFSCNYN